MSVKSPILVTNKYKITNIPSKTDRNVMWLRDGEVFLIRFPIYKYKEVTTIEGQVIGNKNGEILDFKVYETGFKTPYHIFYDFDERVTYENRFITGLENTIKFTFHQWGIEDVD